MPISHGSSPSASIPEEYRLEQFDYELPAALIAQHPSGRRDTSRLLVLPREGAPEHAIFHEIGQYLSPGDLLVANDTRVLKARFFVQRRGGGKAQVLLLHPADEPGVWEAMARPGQRIRVGDKLRLDADAGIEIVGRTGLGTRLIKFYGVDADDAMLRYGNVPLPPYIKQAPPDALERYQTVYARDPGSAAAPTAGLHFTPELLDRLRNSGLGWATITLHVGAGTFQPVKSEDIRQHRMHAERYEIGEAAVKAIDRARARGSRVVAVGTTTLRALEDAARHSPAGNVEPGARWTQIFVYPRFDFRVVDALLTNFHLPKSTLLMLVCAFAGRERILEAYGDAVQLNYRFYSFGDAMLAFR